MDWPQARLRIMDRGQGIIGLGIDIEALGDCVVEYGGARILVVEPDANHLQGITLDVDDTPDGPELVVAEKKI